MQSFITGDKEVGERVKMGDNIERKDDFARLSVPIAILTLLLWSFGIPLARQGTISASFGRSLLEIAGLLLWGTNSATVDDRILSLTSLFEPPVTPKSWLIWSEASSAIECSAFSGALSLGEHPWAVIVLCNCWVSCCSPGSILL